MLLSCSKALDVPERSIDLTVQHCIFDLGPPPFLRPTKRPSKHAQLVEACAAAVADQTAEVAAAAQADPSQCSAAGGLRCSKCGLDFKTTIAYSGWTLRWESRLPGWAAASPAIT